MSFQLLCFCGRFPCTCTELEKSNREATPHETSHLRIQGNQISVVKIPEILSAVEQYVVNCLRAGDCEVIVVKYE